MKIRSISILLFIIIFFSCEQKDTRPAGLAHPQWSKGKTLYQLNVRQFSTSGTFKAIELRLIALKDVGAGIISLTPVFPIGEKNRRGSLGSVYAVKDFRSLNPEFGTMADFKSLVRRIHQMGMFVILDWVPDQTSRDNALLSEHPDWFVRDSLGTLLMPESEPAEVAKLNYKKPSLQDYMIAAMKFWIEKTDVDGFHLGVVPAAPVAFWNRLHRELNGIKPVFMLTEDENPALHLAAFDASFSWNLYRLMNRIARQKSPASAIDSLLNEEQNTYPADALRIRFTSNYQVNAGQGTVFERLGDGVKTFAVLSAILPGAPFLYSGQEAGMDERLSLYERQPIKWRANYYRRFYSRLFNLYQHNAALNSGSFEKIISNRDEAVYACIRKKGENKIVAVLNLSSEKQKVQLLSTAIEGHYRGLFTGQKKRLHFNENFDLQPWEYFVFVSTND